MFQQIIALIIIFFFVVRLFSLKRKKIISPNEFIFWLVFWLVAGLSIIFIKKLDALAARVGFTASAVNLLVYVAVVSLFYFNFRLRLKIEKMDKDITKIVSEMAIKKNKEDI